MVKMETYEFINSEYSCCPSAEEDDDDPPGRRSEDVEETRTDGNPEADGLIIIGARMFLPTTRPGAAALPLLGIVIDPFVITSTSIAESTSPVATDGGLPRLLPDVVLGTSVAVEGTFCRIIGLLAGNRPSWFGRLTVGSATILSRRSFQSMMLRLNPALNTFK